MFKLSNNKVKDIKMPIQCNLLKLIGVWPLEKSNPPSFLGFLYYLISVFIFLLICGCITFETMYVKAVWGDIVKVTEGIIPLLTGAQTTPRLIYMIIYREELKNLIKLFCETIWISGFEIFIQLKHEFTARNDILGKPIKMCLHHV